MSQRLRGSDLRPVVTEQAAKPASAITPPAEAAPAPERQP